VPGELTQKHGDEDIAAPLRARDGSAYELVENGLLTTDGFRDFTFANAVRRWGEVNPRFFEGTAVAKAAVLTGRNA
jgi:hypothetical protein